MVSKQALDNANRDYLAELNKRDAARAQIGVDMAKLKQAKAQVLQSEASLKQLEEQLSYTTIVAPMDGTVLSRDVEIGDAVSSILVLGSTATLIFTEGDTSQVYVQGKVDEADIAHVYMNQPARASRSRAFATVSLTARSPRLLPWVWRRTTLTTFEVRVSIDNPGGELKANMTANAEILLDEHKGVLTVPENAVMYDPQKNATVEIPDKSQKRRQTQDSGQGRPLQWVGDGSPERRQGRRPGHFAAVGQRSGVKDQGSGIRDQNDSGARRKSRSPAHRIVRNRTSVLIDGAPACAEALRKVGVNSGPVWPRACTGSQWLRLSGRFVPLNALPATQRNRSPTTDH